jgi:hypothetical protein
MSATFVVHAMRLMSSQSMRTCLSFTTARSFSQKKFREAHGTEVTVEFHYSAALTRFARKKNPPRGRVSKDFVIQLSF